jgi:hypothetical protein
MVARIPYPLLVFSNLALKIIFFQKQFLSPQGFKPPTFGSMGGPAVSLASQILLISPTLLVPNIFKLFVLFIISNHHHLLLFKLSTIFLTFCTIYVIYRIFPIIYGLFLICLYHSFYLLHMPDYLPYISDSFVPLVLSTPLTQTHGMKARKIAFR